MRGYVVLLVLLTVVQASAAEEYMGLVWDYSTKEILSGVTVGDVDGDGELEVAASGSSDGSAYLLGADGELLWRKDVGSYINTVWIDDLGSDGSGEVVSGHSDIYVFDSAGDRIWRYSTRDGVYDVRSGDLDGDGRTDIAFTTYDKSSCSRSGFVYAVDGTQKEELWKYSVGDSLPSSILVEDLNGDGVDEVIVGLIYRAKSSYKACQNAMDHESSIYVLSENRLMWQYQTQGAVLSLATGDVDGDGLPEVVAGTYPNLYVLDGDGSLLWEDTRVIADYVVDVAAADLDGDNMSEVIGVANEVYAFKSDGALKWTGGTEFSRTYSVTTGDLDGDGLPEVIAGSSHIYVFDRDGVQRWRSGPYGYVGFVLAADIEGGGFSEIIAGSKKNVTVYRTTSYAKMVRADELYQDAIRISTSNPEEAVEKFRQARELYSELGVIERVSECINRIDRLGDTSARVEDLRAEAELALFNARKALDFRDYLNASRYAHIAEQKYSAPQLNDQSAAEDAESIIEEAEAWIEENASREFSLANESAHAGDLEKALEHAELAEKHYSFIGYGEHTERARATVEALRSELGIETEKESEVAVPDLSGLREALDAVKAEYVIIFLIAAVMIFILVLLLYYVWKMSGRQRLKTEHLHRVYYDQEVDVAPAANVRRRSPDTKRYSTAEDEEIRVQLPPNKGVFKSSVCRDGVCLKMTRLKSR